MEKSRNEQGCKIYTTAPEGYDSFGTETVEVIGTTSDGRQMRCVLAQQRHAEWQRRRYRSGNHFAIDEAEAIKRGHLRMIESHEWLRRMADREAASLSLDTRHALLLMFGCDRLPAVVPRGSELENFVDDSGLLSPWGKEIAARVVLADPDCLLPLRNKALAHLGRQEVASS